MESEHTPPPLSETTLYPHLVVPPTHVLIVTNIYFTQKKIATLKKIFLYDTNHTGVANNLTKGEPP